MTYYVYSETGMGKRGRGEGTKPHNHFVVEIRRRRSIESVISKLAIKIR